MILNNVAIPEEGLLQRCEDECGLGRGGITGDSELLSKFVGWLNQWHKMGVSYRIMSGNGADADDPNYTTLPSGTITGTTNRDYNMDASYFMLKLKSLNVSYDGVNSVPASPLDSNDRRDLAMNDVNIDASFSTDFPEYDEIANGWKLYPKFTAAQVAAGAFVYPDFYRAPKLYATSGTDSYGVALDLQFHHFPAIGASYEYCKLNLPSKCQILEADLYGNGGQKKGLIKDLQEWEASKQPSNTRLTMRNQVKR